MVHNPRGKGDWIPGWLAVGSSNISHLGKFGKSPRLQTAGERRDFV